MCNPSAVTYDWVTKGCHIKVDNVELSVRPDHRGGLIFVGVFSRDDDRVDAAIRRAISVCLPDPAVRRRWIQYVEGGITLMTVVRGELQKLALGRMAEFHFVLVALRGYAAL